jgi:hypothetical protein
MQCGCFDLHFGDDINHWHLLILFMKLSQSMDQQGKFSPARTPEYYRYDGTISYCILYPIPPEM